jgi:anti-anti-sigma regulatory factor
MTGRARHGLHLVREGDAQGAPQTTSALPDSPGRRFLSLRQQSVVLAIGGRMNADTAGRLRMFLSMFTVDSGPGELVLDLSGVFAVDEDGMAPVFEADEMMRLRMASLRLAPVSASVAQFLDDVRCGRTLATDGPPEWDSDPGGPVPGDDRPHHGQD